MEFLRQAWAWFLRQPVWLRIVIAAVLVYMILYAMGHQVPYVPGLDDGNGRGH